MIHKITYSRKRDNKKQKTVIFVLIILLISLAGIMLYMVTDREPVEKKNADGEIRFYENGVASYAGLVKDAEGNYYYINSSKKAVKNVTYGIGSGKTNDLLPSGTYKFGPDGKMIDPPVA